MTKIALGHTYTRIRGGGYGRSAWIARITGLDEKYGLARSFCRKHPHLSSSGRSGTIGFDVTEPGLYEFRGFCVGSTPTNWEWSGFCEVTTAGMVQLSRDDVLARFTRKDAA